MYNDNRLCKDFIAFRLEQFLARNRGRNLISVQKHLRFVPFSSIGPAFLCSEAFFQH